MSSRNCIIEIANQTTHGVLFVIGDKPPDPRVLGFTREFVCKFILRSIFGITTDRVERTKCVPVLKGGKDWLKGRQGERKLRIS